MRLSSRPGWGPTARRCGFTILELLVAAAIFVLVALVVLNVTDHAVKLTKISNWRMGSDNGARQALNRMAADFSSAVLSPELPDRIEKIAGNDQLTFYVRAEAYDEGDRGIACVSYRVMNEVLARGVEGSSWEAGADSPSLEFAGLELSPDPLGPGIFKENGSADPTPLIASEDSFEVLSPAVFRFEYCFLLKDGSLATVPITTPAGVLHQANGSQSPERTGAGYGVNSRWYRPTAGGSASRTFVCVSSEPGKTQWKRLGWEDVRAVVVGIASIDPELRRSFGADLTAENMADLASRFGEAAEGKDILEAWEGWRDRIETTGLPRPVLNAVRVHQRYFFLHE